MIKRTRELIYGQTGQVVENYPPEWIEGIPSSASVVVLRGSQDGDDTANAEFTPSVTIDAVSTTFDAASGYSQATKNVASLTATTDIAVGRHYLAENTKSQRELVTVMGIVAADSVILDDNLKYDYASSSTFKGLRMTFTVDATWVADESNLLAPEVPPYRVIWTYTVNSQVRRDYTYLRLVRQIPKHSISIQSIRAQWPDVSFDEWAARRGEGFAYLIDAAWERLRIDLITSGYKPDQFRDSEIIDQLVLLKSMHLLAKAILNLQAEIDQGTSGGITVSPLQTLWFRR